jgi:tetratricopeptide (TPR) repeat protein
MQVLLTTIGRNGLGHGGLVLVTSRQPVVELLRFRFVRGIELGMLDARAGHELLRDLGVRGSTEELLAAVRDHQGHPLSLVLLARMLADSYDGDILHRVNLEVFDADTDIEDGIALILDRYVAGWDEDSPELTVLYAVSLFRRPAEEEELNLLAERSDLGRRLRVLSGNQLRRTVNRLRSLGLIMVSGGRYDQHALVRQYFAGRFAQRHPQLHRQAHEILFDHFRTLPEEELPVDLKTMEPLYRAIHHGCCAGRYALALDVYWKRVSRQKEFYSQKQLGAYSSDLVAIAPFFPDGWETPVRGDLTEEQRALLIALGAFLLSALGRMADSVRPRYTEIAMFEELGDLRLVSGDLRNLVQALVPLGRLAEALRAADRAVEVAGRMNSGVPGTYSAGFDDRFLHVSALARRATVLHRMGRTAEAGQTFDEATRMHGGPLTRANAYYHGLYLADVAHGRDDAEALLQLGLHNLSAATERGDLGDIGYSLLLTAHARRASGEPADAEADLDSAVVALSRANRIDRLPAALIQRAEVYRERWRADGDDARRELADTDLAEAERLVEFSGMLLYRVDLVALRVALLLDVGDGEQARELIDTVLQPDVELTGYHLRDDVVAALRERARLR